MESSNKTQLITPRRLFFVDSENGLDALIRGCQELNENDSIIIFHRNSISKKSKEKLAACRAKVEWVECFDREIKNSMDFQIVTDYCLRLSRDEFDEGYIISCDKGYLPAINYLKREYVNSGRVMMTATNIYQALYESQSIALRNLKQYKEKELIERVIEFYLGKQAMEAIRSAYEDTSFECEGPKKGIVHMEINCAPMDIFTTGVTSDAILSELGTLKDDAKWECDLTELKGIGASLSRRLKEVGIDTALKLKYFGAVEAWKKIHECDSTFSHRWVYLFDTAIANRSPGDISPERKQQLKNEVQKLIS